MQKTSGVSGLNAQLKTARTGLLPRASFGHVNDRFTAVVENRSASLLPRGTAQLVDLDSVADLIEARNIFL
jgi:hypothetical protein